MLATQTLILLGTPPNRVLRQLREVRGERYEFMRGFFPGATDVADPEFDFQQPRLQSFLVTEGAAAVGRTLASLDLATLEVQVTALRRQGKRRIQPPPDLIIEQGDVLILAGAPEALGKAEIAILQGR